MVCYRIAGQEFCFPAPLRELEPFAVPGDGSFVPPAFLETEFADPSALTLVSRAEGWVADASRLVEVWSAASGLVLRVDGGHDVYLAPGGRALLPLKPIDAWTNFDRQIVLGPGLVLALALRGVWSLHASAATFGGRTVTFVGESGRGKSTLAAYLSSSGRPKWSHVADDILPITLETGEMSAWPRFPQLKMSVAAQPGVLHAERLRVDYMVQLNAAGEDASPQVEQLPMNQAAQVLLGQIAGARLFDAALLGKHLSFCAQAAKQVPVYRLVYPHRRDALPVVMGLLEDLLVAG